MDELQLKNARAVVKVWRNADHIGAWGAAAARKPASELFAEAWDAVLVCSRTVDEQTERLRRAGFLPSHREMRYLRGLATNLADRANHIRHWTDALVEAEKEDG